MKVYVVGGDFSTESMFLKRGWEITLSPDDADLLQFTGGSDVDPALYGEERHATTRSNPDRDAFESHIYCSYPDKPKAGICRGGQFLNVMHGGKLWQNINGHHKWHSAVDVITGEVLIMSSDHHQMIRPTTEAMILLGSDRSTFRETATEKNVDKIFLDIEAVLYPGSLCYQPHPEWAADDHDCCITYFRYLKEYLNLEKV